MLRRTASCLATASAVMLAGGIALATPAMADGGQVGPKQYFDGEVLCQPGNDINLAGLVASQSD